jgi:hypothetical protein
LPQNRSQLTQAPSVEVEDEAEGALLELAKSLVGELAGGRVLELLLADQQGPHTKAAQQLAGARWKHDMIGGRPVKQVLGHPDSPTMLYDLADGHFAEGVKGKVGPVMHSDQFDSAALAKLGWKPPIEPEPEADDNPAGGPGESQSGGARASAGTARSGGQPASPKPDRYKDAQHTEDILSREMTMGGATSEGGTLDGHGQVWHPDRASVHSDIVQKHLTDAADTPGEGRAIMLGGLGQSKPGALAKAGAYDPSRYAVVSPELILSDLAKAGLVPEMHGLDWKQSAPLAYEEAAHVASMIASALTARRKNMVLDGSMTNPDADAERISRLRGSGYREVRGIHLHTPVEKAVDRSRGKIPAQAHRASALSHGEDASSQGFEQTKDKLDGWESWDHSGSAPAKKKTGGKPPAPAGAASIEDVLAGRGLG